MDLRNCDTLWENTGDYAYRQLDKLIRGLVDRGSRIVDMKEYAEKR